MSQNISNVKNSIISGKTILGIELGSTRIKAVLIGEDHLPIASGSHDWTNSNIDGIWTYSLDDVWVGLQNAYKNMVTEIKETYDVAFKKAGAIGISAMMHGYLVFDKDDGLLVPFRTWRNNLQGEASEALTKLFNYPVPQRWGIAHLYQAILNGEEHVKDIAMQTTLSSYLHYKLTGEKFFGANEASGMFPIDLDSVDFNQTMINQFEQTIEGKGITWGLRDILPEVLIAGEDAGRLTEEGAILLDPTGMLEAGAPLCPPEGDAGTGMVATNSVAVRTGNVSAGTSVFAMVVLEKDLSKVHPEIDQITTPTGKLVAMAHSNNCTSNLNTWVDLFEETIETFGFEVDKNTLYEKLYKKALEGDADGGGLLSYGYLSGEHMTHFENGCPIFVHPADSNFNLANFMRVNLFTALGALKIGLDILLKQESVNLDEMLGHGGLFKTEGVGQRFMAAATGVPVSIMETAGEGGAWGIALLAAFRLNKGTDETLEDYLNNKVFNDSESVTLAPDPMDVAGFETFMERYKKGLDIERAAVNYLE